MDPGDDTWIEVHFKRNTYRWSMIGVNQAGDKVFALACEGIPGQMGYTLEEAAKELKTAGAYQALAIDGGQDVFQKVFLGMNGPKANVAGGGPPLDITVNLKRTRLRATYIFAKKKQ